MDIFVLPSLSEALSNSLMEAMASGRCVVASRVGGNPELVTHGETGMLFEAGDAGGLAATLRVLIGDASLRRTLGERAAETMRTRFSLEAAAARMEQIYTSLLS
jgi:glycosyltransferase involved in cell wall biosynthesis